MWEAGYRTRRTPGDVGAMVSDPEGLTPSHRARHLSSLVARDVGVGLQLALAGGRIVQGLLRLRPADDLVEVRVVLRLGIAAREIDRLLHLVGGGIDVGVE